MFNRFKILPIFASLSAFAILISGILSLSPDDAWARGGRGGRSGGRVSVRGYYRSNGTYVSPYTRSSPGGGISGYSSGYRLRTNNSLFGIYMNQGYEATRDKNYESALYWFQEALRENPNNPYALKAIQNVNKYAHSSPRFSTGYTVGGRVDMFESYMKMGYSATESKIYDLALYRFQQALSERPNNPYAIKAIQNIKVYMQRNQW